jgi:hypothetical protein
VHASGRIDFDDLQGERSRVQVADFLAGIARRIAEDELSGAGDPELVGLG